MRNQILGEVRIAKNGGPYKWKVWNDERWLYCESCCTAALTGQMLRHKLHHTSWQLWAAMQATLKQWKQRRYSTSKIRGMFHG